MEQKSFYSGIKSKVHPNLSPPCLTKWSESNKIISENQAGFRKGCQTFDHIFRLQTLAKQYINKKQKLFVCFVDFKKAYDLVLRNSLLYKLLKYGISSEMKNMISSIYSNVNSYVKVNGTLSKSFGCSLGLRQGCVLTPILFSLFINDLDEDMRSLNTMGSKLYDTVIHTLLYEDDLIIFANSKEELQMKLDKLSDFCSKWELVVGLPKKKIMILGGGYNVAKKNLFYFRGSCVEIVKYCTYLGVTFKHNLLFDKHIEMVQDAATKAEFGVISELSNFKNYDVTLALKLFDTLVSPIKEHGIELWGHKDLEKIERINLHFYKFILGIKQSAAGKAVYGELGRRPLSCRYKWKQVKFWSRVIELPDTRLVKKAFNLAMELNEASALIKSLKKTLWDIDKQLNWDNQNHFSKFEINSEIKQKVNSCFDKNWSKELAESVKGKKGNSKLRTYKEFKQALKLEKYLTCVSVRAHQIALTKLRTSAHQLRIETGRYQKLEEAERKRLLCELGEIESEIHFLTRCPFSMKGGKLF